MKTVFLVRGLPASGKSTLARYLANLVVSADDYFMIDGEYKFDPSKLSEAHADCQWRTRWALKGGDPNEHFRIAVANTFTQRWEMEPYLKIAEAAGARVYVIDLYDGGLTDEQLFERNTHEVPLDTIKRMRTRYEHNWREGNPIPPWNRRRK